MCWQICNTIYNTSWPCETFPLTWLNKGETGLPYYFSDEVLQLPKVVVLHCDTRHHDAGTQTYVRLSREEKYLTSIIILFNETDKNIFKICVWKWSLKKYFLPHFQSSTLLGHFSSLLVSLCSSLAWPPGLFLCRSWVNTTKLRVAIECSCFVHWWSKYSRYSRGLASLDHIHK
jgi:hypothetical protein